MKTEPMMPEAAKPPIPSVQYGERVISAYIAAAVGDALGWPFEGHSKTVPSVERWDGNYFRWEKRAGSRYRPVLELIEAGEYSDDTQLILAVTRSRLHGGADWWMHFSQCELPFWTLYERGGGGATKRAASSWLSSGPPWRSTKSDAAQKYFSAGGNGVAMRVLPHCVAGINSDSFEPVALDIITDGVTTHGHPRALIGALLYGYALWYTLRLGTTLDFGELVYAAMSSASEWGEYRSVCQRWDDWEDCASEGRDYVALWRDTVGETLHLLKIAVYVIQAGALALDTELLDGIGARNSKVSGAGTVTAVAAIYFASRYAASPNEGLRCAASAVGADTDTVASMTGGLLGALSESGWIKKYIPSLQDSAYIAKLSAAMAEGNSAHRAEYHPVRKSDLAYLTSALSASTPLHGARLPNGMIVERVLAFDFDNRAGHQSYWELLTNEGIKLFVRMPKSLAMQNNQRRQLLNASTEERSEIQVEGELDFFAGLSLGVSNLENALVFYQNILGLSISGRSDKVVRFGQFLAFKHEPGMPEGPKGVTIYLRVQSLNSLRERLAEVNYPNLSDVVESPKRRTFTCADPDGYLVEFIQDKQLQ